MERPRAYVHLPTASLQLIYDLRLEVPEEAKSLSLFHVDERLEGDQLVARLDRETSRPVLMPLKDGQPTGRAVHPEEGQAGTGEYASGMYLAESFARQEGWLVRDERIRWKDWVRQQRVEPAGQGQRPGAVRREGQALLKKIVPRKAAR